MRCEWRCSRRTSTWGSRATLLGACRKKPSGPTHCSHLQPDQRVISIVHDELVELLGGKAAQPSLKNESNVWLLLGLQGAGKTTTAGKLAYKYKSQGRRPLLVAADTQRPAAREQLRVLGNQIGVPVLEVEDDETPERTKVRLKRSICGKIFVIWSSSIPPDVSRSTRR